MVATGVVVALVAVVWSGVDRGPKVLPTEGGVLDSKGALACIVVRAAGNLRTPSQAEALAETLAAQHVGKVWVQFKQDETDEVEGGRVFYPSKIAPVADGFEDGRLLAFVAALRKAGIAVAAWLPAFHDPVAWTKQPKWRAHWINEEGQAEEQPGWLCPRNPEAVAYEASLLAEVARLTHGQIEGIYTDFIRYDDDFSCGCRRCLDALAKKRGVTRVRPEEIRDAPQKNHALWRDWVALRGDAIHDALDTMRDALDEASPDLWFGASVLPFSAMDYSLNTQSGQDLAKMSLAGVDEIVLMGYWDDWEKSPLWVEESIEHAQRLVGKDAEISCLLDGDMSVRRTMKTLEAVRNTGADVGWFHYGEWNDELCESLHRAASRLEKLGDVPRAEFTAVTIRIDTEPDSEMRYDTVQPEMIAKLLDLFREEGVKATFITVGKLAEQQTAVLRRAVAEGHELGGHGYNHEQIDALPEAQQAPVIDRTTDSLCALGFSPVGFGAPRNSITDLARNRLIERGYFYDGSAAYDPMESYLDPQVVPHTEDPLQRIIVLPFIVPNDWDARYIAGISAERMLEQWKERLEEVAGAGEPCFVLDIHQWIAAQPDNFEAVRGFIRAVRARKDCRILTLEQTARHVLGEIGRAEGVAVDPGTVPVP